VEAVGSSPAGGATITGANPASAMTCCMCASMTPRSSPIPKILPDEKKHSAIAFLDRAIRRAPTGRPSASSKQACANGPTPAPTIPPPSGPTRCNPGSPITTTAGRTQPQWHASRRATEQCAWLRHLSQGVWITAQLTDAATGTDLWAGPNYRSRGLFQTSRQRRVDRKDFSVTFHHFCPQIFRLFPFRPGSLRYHEI
jgi:hypothetical protein